MKRILVVSLTGWVMAVSTMVRANAVAVRNGAAAGQAADTMPTVDQILEKYVAAAGGQSAIEKLTTRVMRGSAQLTSTGEMGTLEIFKKAPDKALYILNIPSNGPTPRAYNGKTGWVLYDPDEGARDVPATDLPAMKREFDFYREIRLKALYPKRTVKGREKVGDQDTYVIEATADDGATERWYFATQTGLLVRSDAPYVTEDGNSFVQTVYEDYRDVDGVKLPFVWRQTSPDFDYVIKFTQIQNNVPIEDSKFEKPAA